MKAIFKVFILPYFLVSYGIVAAVMIDLNCGSSGAYNELAPFIALALIALLIAFVTSKTRWRGATLLLTLLTTPIVFVIAAPLAVVLLRMG